MELVEEGFLGAGTSDNAVRAEKNRELKADAIDNLADFWVVS